LRTIFAMGGGGFAMEPGNPALDEFILTLPGRPVPRVCFLPTASGDADEQVRRFTATFGDRPCVATHLSLFRLGRNPVDVREHLLAQDIVYVGGGSMRNMLAIWREHGLDAILRECWAQGTVLAGLSAGAMCWFERGISTSTGRPAPVSGLGLLPGSLSVHRDGEPARLPVYLDAVRRGELPPGYAADDGVGLLFEEGELTRAVSSRPAAGASRVDADGEHELRVEVLGRRGAPEHERSAPFEVMELRSLRYGALRD
jgi:peptidase E